MKYVLALAVVLVLLDLNTAASFKTKALLNRFQDRHRRGDDGNEGENNLTNEQKRFYAYYDTINFFCKEFENRTARVVCNMTDHMDQQLHKIRDSQIQAHVEKRGIKNMDKFECLFLLTVSEHLEIPGKPGCLAGNDPSITVDYLTQEFNGAALLDRKRNTGLKDLWNDLAQYIQNLW